MADEIVSALNGLSKTTQKLVDDRIAEAEKAEQDRKEQISALNKQIKDGDGRTKEIKEAKAELNQIKVDAKVAKSINLEVSRSSAAALGISEEELRARKEQLILQKDNKVATEQLAESIKSATVDPLADQKNQLEIMRATLEANGQVATDSKEYNKLQYELQSAELAERIRTADSPAAKKELKNEQRALAAKQEGLLGRIAGGINFLRENAKEKLKSAGKGVMTLLKGFAIAGFALALIAFLNSEYWEKTKTYIVDILVPKLKEFYNAFFGEGGGLMKGFKTLFGDNSGIGNIVLGIAGVTALFATAKLVTAFAPLKGAISGLLSGIGGIASKIPGLGGGGDPRGKNQRAARPPRRGGGGGFGGMIANIAAGIGKGAAAILKSLAMGLKAFTPQVLLGAGILGGSILAIGAGIAGAAWLTGKALPTFTKGVKGFEELDGEKLILAAKGIAAIGGAMVAMGAGSVVSAVGGVIGSIGKFFTGDKETPLEQLKKFGDAKINTVQATANANALVAYSKAMAASGGADAVKGIGDFVSGTLGSLGNFFAGEKKVDPLSQLKEFGETKINSEQVIANADSMIAYSKAMIKGSAGAATGGLATFASGVMGSIGKFFGGKDVDPLSQLKKFGDATINSAGVIANTEAMTTYATAMANAKKANPTLGEGVSGFITGALGGIAKFFGKDSPLEKLKKFGDMDINSAGVIKNATAMADYTKAIGGMTSSSKTELDLFTDSVLDMKKAIDSLKDSEDAFELYTSTRLSITNLGKSRKNITQMQSEGLSIPVNVVGQAMVNLSGQGAKGMGTTVNNITNNYVNSQQTNSAMYTAASTKNDSTAGKLAAVK